MAIIRPAVEGGTVLLGSTAITTAGNITTAVTVNTITAVNVSGGWTVTVTTASRPVRVAAYVNKITHSSTGNAVVLLYQDGSLVQAASFDPAVATKGSACTLVWFGSPAAGSHTYEVKVVSNVTGNLVMWTDPTTPAFLTVMAV